MDCNIFKEKGILYLYGELNEQETQTFRRHIESCSYCKKEILNLKKTMSIFKEKRMNKPDLEAVKNIVQTITEKGFSKPHVLSLPFNYKSPVFTFCSAAAVLMIAFLFFHGKDFVLLRKEVSWKFEDEIEMVRQEVDEQLGVFDEEINVYSSSFFNEKMEEIEVEVSELWVEMNEV
ncbi:zf-HC2 domain-containing protein [bacterium]|nr:zf-HC2 domain-containing protein [bacterium]